MTQKASPLLNWLRRHKPPIVRLTLQGGVTKDLARPDKGRGTWTVLEQAIEQLEPVLVEAIGNDGKTAVGSPFTPETVEEEDEQPANATEIQVTDSHAAVAVQIIERVLPKIAQLFVESNDMACARLAEAWNAGNKQQLDLIQMLYGRLNSLEAAWDMIRMERMQQASQAAEDSNDTLVRTIAERFGMPVPPPNGTSPNASDGHASGNGKAQ